MHTVQLFMMLTPQKDHFKASEKEDHVSIHDMLQPQKLILQSKYDPDAAFLKCAIICRQHSIELLDFHRIFSYITELFSFLLTLYLTSIVHNLALCFSLPVTDNASTQIHALYNVTTNSNTTSGAFVQSFQWTVGVHLGKISPLTWKRYCQPLTFDTFDLII